MFKKICLLILFLGFLKTIAQPSIEPYLNIQSYIRKNSQVMSVEEKHELLLKEVTTQPLKVTMTFNRDGNITSEKKFGKKDGMLSETKWDFNNQKLVKKTHKYFVNMLGWKFEETTFSYNDSGCLADIRYTKDGVLLTSSTVECDTSGNPSEIRVYDGSGVHSNNELVRYIPSANLIKVMVYKFTNQFIGSFNYPLDGSKPIQNGNVKKEYYPNGDLKLESLSGSNDSDQGYYYEYKYDNKGNWIEKTTFQVSLGKNNKIKNKKAEHIITRTITYY